MISAILLAKGNCRAGCFEPCDRGPIVVSNDGQHPLHVTLYNSRMKRIGDHWSIGPGEHCCLSLGGVTLTGRGNYLLKIAGSRAWIRLKDSGEFEERMWRVPASEIWGAVLDQEPAVERSEID